MSSARSSGPPRQRLDTELVRRRLVATRSQADSYIKLGRVEVDKQIIRKSGWPTSPSAHINVTGEQYVSRGALKLDSVAEKLKLYFKDKVVLDVGSSTGGFTDFALRAGAKKVIAVDVGTDQLHPKLRADERVELHEKTDIRDFTTSQDIDLALIDVSFISVRQVLSAVAKLTGSKAKIVAMVKPQFEAGDKLKNKGVIKNDAMRRQILKDFETWAKSDFVIQDKADADVAGAKGNRERLYLLKRG